MSEPGPRYRAVIQRRATDEESVQIEVQRETQGDLARDIDVFLEQLRQARIRHNEDVIAVFQRKADELDALIQTKGQTVRDLDAQIVERQSRLANGRADRRRNDPNLAGAY